MKVPLSWLKEYVPVDLPAEEIARRLTMAGIETAGIQRTGSWSGIVVGEVRRVRPHPNADRLRLVTVNHGQGEVEVVCGAPNVAEGQKIAFGGVGAEVFDGHTGKFGRLKASKIRGVESAGMVLSEKELGLSERHEGILVLDSEAPIGKPLGELLGETVIDLELSPNRADCLGVLGVAREVAALSDLKAMEPPLGYQEAGSAVSSLASVEIAAPDLCPRYTATVITGIKVGPSPQWLQERLKSLGERPINNVVDATNFVMFELGQPLHAFDYDLVGQHRIVVRTAKKGEKLVTLDKVERTLTDDMLVIADPERAIGLAGVMGGANSEISEKTTAVLLESANFQPSNNRRTARGLGLASEATVRFEKGLRQGLAEVGLRRCIGIILEVAGGQAARGIIDAWPGKGTETDAVVLTEERVRTVLGVDWSGDQIEKSLRQLGMRVSLAGAGAWTVAVPYWRTDVVIPEDLCEELARVIGYDRIPTTVISGRVPRWEPQPDLQIRETVRDTLVDAGLQETISYSATTERGEIRLKFPASMPGSVRLENPISAELEVLRRTLREGLLAAYSRNARHWRGPVALFEIGKVFSDVGEGLPDEKAMIAGVLGGSRSPVHWSGEKGVLDFYDAKGAVETVLEKLRIEAIFSPGSDPALGEGRAATVTVPAAGGLKLGVIGEVSQEVLAAFDIDAGPVALFELDLEALLKASATRTRRSNYRPYARFPESTRDLALLADESIPAGEIIRVTERNRLVARAITFDVFKGKGVPAGKKSMAVRVVYRATDRTLTSEEVAKTEQVILETLKKELGVELRQQ